VQVTWYEPDWHNSKKDRRYIIELQHKNDASNWFEDVVFCSGDDPQYLVDCTEGCSCFLPMSDFTDP